MRLATTKRPAPVTTAAPPAIKAIFGSCATDGSPATGNKAMGVGLGVGSGSGVGPGLAMVGMGGMVGIGGIGSTKVRS